MAPPRPDAERRLLEACSREAFTAGAWRPSSDGRTMPVGDPATGEILCEVADAAPQDGLAALTAADEAFDGWRDAPPRERADVLRAAYDLMVTRTEARPY